MASQIQTQWPEFFYILQAKPLQKCETAFEFATP